MDPFRSNFWAFQTDFTESIWKFCDKIEKWVLFFSPGRVIQSLNEDQSQEFPTPLPSHNSPEEVKKLFTKRKKHLDHKCEIKKSNPVEPFINDPSHLLVLPDRNVVWCPVFKAGSSTWLSIILDLSSVSKVCSVNFNVTFSEFYNITHAFSNDKRLVKAFYDRGSFFTSVRSFLFSGCS